MKLHLSPSPSAPAPVVLRWLGSKLWLAEHLASLLLPLLGAGGRYFEPFLGSAAVFLSLRVRGWSGPAVLGDKLSPVIQLYQALQHPDRLAFALSVLENWLVDDRCAPLAEDNFLRARAGFNLAVKEEGSRLLPGLLLFLNGASFNGLYRTNKKGLYNSTFAKGQPRRYATRAELEACGRAFAGSELVTGDFEPLIARADAGDVVYCDPPYAGTFTRYAGAFRAADQKRLADSLRAAVERGASIVVSSSDTPEIRALYSWARVVPLRARYLVGGRGGKEAQELLITCGTSLLD